MSHSLPVSRRVFLTAASAAGVVAAGRGAEPPAPKVDDKAIDAAVAEAMKVWPVPGVCVGVVRDGKVTHLKGYGVRDVDTKKAVTADTLFGIASCGKAFAAATAAALVDDKKVAWDDPVRKHVPWFRMADPLTEREITLRDCLCHRTGLHTRHDLLYYRAAWSTEEVVRRIAHLELGVPFRSVFHYSGMNFCIVPAVLSAAAGKPWHEYARERLLGKIGMGGATFTRAEWDKAEDRATTHLRTPEGKAVVIPAWTPADDQICANGRLRASGKQMCEWLRFHLAGGGYDGKRVVSEEGLRETHTPQVVIPRDGFWGDALPKAESVQLSYAMGWMVRDYRGHAVLSHGGRTTGFSAEMALVPKAGVGVVILTNLDECWLPEALLHTLLDRLLGLPAKDWNDYYHKLDDKLTKAAKDEKAERAKKRKPDTKPTLPLADYIGTYTDSAYGEVKVSEKTGTLWMHWSTFEGVLRHFHFDTFTATGDGGVNVYNENPLDGEEVTFVVDGEGKAGELLWYGRRFQRKVVKK